MPLKGERDMSTIELRTSVLTEIASIMDREDLLKEALVALRKITKAKKAAPCRFTVEELKKEIELSEEDDKNDRYFTTAELRKKHPLCPQN